MLPGTLTHTLEAILQRHCGHPVRIQGSDPVGGGCIHQARRLNTSRGHFFLKYNRLPELPNFQAEAAGLALLKDARVIAVPEPILAGQGGDHAFLLLEYIAGGTRQRNFWTHFGQTLAQLHRHTRPRYGLDRDNFIGRLPQQNDWRDRWTDFFVEMRLEPQLELAEANGYADAGLRRDFEALYRRLPELVPDEPASLLHGDLWSGNFMCGPEGSAVLVDPAVYYGHREMEIAFTRLFGGFDPEFYAAYQAAWPLQKGWETRLDLMNLYPLAVHLNLFGRSYLPEIRATLRKYT